MIEISQLRYTWPGTAHEVLHIPSLSIPEGQKLFLQGPSGSGKSTLLGLMAGVLVPQSGHVRMRDTDWAQCSAGQRDSLRADHIGLIFQQFNLLPYLSAVDNVCLPCTFSKLRRDRASAQSTSLRAAAQTLLSQMQLPRHTWQQAACQLSVGQQQRVAAARALMGDPDLIIADEPTSALDADRCKDFMTLLIQACDAAAAPRTVIFVSHDERLADHFDRRLSLLDLNLATARVQAT